MSLLDNPFVTVCECDCHREGSATRHIAPCCETCQWCDNRIRGMGMRLHESKCKASYDKMLAEVQTYVREKQTESAAELPVREAKAEEPALGRADFPHGKTTMHIFILDDVRNVECALRDAYLAHSPGARYTLARCIDDAVDMVFRNPRFDVWVLDNDLGIQDGVAEEGMEFLKLMMLRAPDKVPDEVISCSANWQRREAIQALFKNWVDNGRQPGLPIGVDP